MIKTNKNHDTQTNDCLKLSQQTSMFLKSQRQIKCYNKPSSYIYLTELYDLSELID